MTLVHAGCGESGGEKGQVLALDPDSLHAWMSAGRSLVVLDTRPDSLYVTARISGAVPAGGRGVSDLRQVLPTDHETAIVFYNGDGTVPPPGADTAREAAESFGFPLVYRLEGGLEAWVARGHGVNGMRSVSPGR